jgi:hypothetical protein
MAGLKIEIAFARCSRVPALVHKLCAQLHPALCFHDPSSRTLSVMNWRRGLLLAGIHLVIAATLIAYQ